MSRAAPDRWVLATRNAGKVAEFDALLDLPNVELVSLDRFDGGGVEETGATFVENAILKARHASRLTGLPALADDSGLVVPALAGAPGILSARFAGAGASDRENVRLLLERLAGRRGAARSAAFHCVVVALRSPADPAPAIGHGIWAGSIAATARGTGGFGYDPVFVDPASGRTAAELKPAEKNALSHRARAVAALNARLAEQARLP